MSMSIYQKGLLLIFIPLTVNIAWIGMYWQSLSKTSTLLDEAERRGKVIFLMSRNVELFNRCAVSLFDFVKSSGNEAVKKRAEQESINLVATLSELEREISDKSVTKAAIQRVRNSMEQVRQTLQILADKPGLSQDDVTGLNLPDKFLDIMKDAHSVLTMIDISDRNLGFTLDEQRNDLHRTKFIVITGLILNLAIGLASSLFFKISVARRIGALSQRVRSLSTQEIESIEEPGKDEFEQLERELSSAKKTLSEEDNFRRVYMNAVALRLQNSLKRCLSASEELKDEEALAINQGYKYVQRLNASVSTCLSLIDDMLLLESLDAGNLKLNVEESDLQAIAGETIDLVSNLAHAKNITVENRCESIILSVDRARLRQVLVNLLANAIKFSKQGSPIQIKSEHRNKFVRISVIDSGPGISKQASSKLFQKFVQTQEGKSAGGTGLGLAIARLITEAHAGLIGVESTEGGGSSFWIELPVKKRFPDCT